MSDTDFFDSDLGRRSNVSRQNLAGQARESGSGAHYDEIPVRPVSELNLTRLARQREQIHAQVSGQAKEIEQLRRRQSEHLWLTGGHPDPGMTTFIDYAFEG